MRGKKWIIIAVVLIVGLLSGYVICCYSQSDSLTDALALYGGKAKIEMVDTLRAGNITYNVFLKNDDTDDMCDVLVYRTQKCFGINMKNRYCYYSNYACPKNDVGLFYILYKDKDSTEKAAVYVYSLNTAEISKINCKFMYNGMDRSEIYNTNPEQPFVKRFDYSNEIPKLYSVIGYASDGRQVYSENFNELPQK